MKPWITDFERSSIPSSYAALWLALLERRGWAREAVVAGSGLDLGALDTPDARVSPAQLAVLVANGVKLTGDLTLGYAFGLEMKPSAHGFLGYALMTCTTLREAIALGERYIRLRVDAARLRLTVEGDLAVLSLQDSFAHGLIRQFALEVVTAAILRAGELLLGEMPEGEIWVDYPEPPYYGGMREQLPPVRFGMPRTELRFPAGYLDRRLALADPLASRDVIAQLERQLALVGGTDDDLAARVRACLDDPTRPFAELSVVASKLHVSERTLKRHLKAQGTSYQQLLDEARCARALALLADQAISIEQVASALGYADPANFTRAFRKWTGQTPSAYRAGRR